MIRSMIRLTGHEFETVRGPNSERRSVVRVLIIDDDPATVAFMHLAFESAGDVVDTASSVDEAMGHVELHPPDVVLSDLTFRHHGDEASDGFLLLQNLRDRPETAHIGVLAVSGADFPEVLRATKDRGFDGFVAKPVDLASLISRVHHLGEQVAARRSRTRTIDGQ